MFVCEISLFSNVITHCCLHLICERCTSYTLTRGIQNWVGCLWPRCMPTFSTNVSLALLFFISCFVVFLFLLYTFILVRLILLTLPLCIHMYVFIPVLSFIFDTLWLCFFGVDLHWPNLQITQMLNFDCDSQPVVMFYFTPHRLFIVFSFI